MVQAAKTQMHATGCQSELVKWIKTNETPISLKRKKRKKEEATSGMTKQNHQILLGSHLGHKTMFGSSDYQATST